MKAVVLFLLLSALSARAAKVLYFRDAPIGTDRMAEALAATNQNVTVATDAADFKTKIESPAFDIGIFFVQKRAASEYAAAIQSLSTFVTARGGRAMYADWSGNAALAAGFGAGFSGSVNARSVTGLTLAPATTAVPEPIALKPTGWYRSSMGLTALAGSSAAAVFANGNAAIVQSAAGRSLMFGFLNDTPEMAAVFQRAIQSVVATIPLEPFHGEYLQLLTGPAGLAGRIQLTLGSGGAFTGRLQVGELDAALPTPSSFGTDGVARVTVSNFAVTLTLQLAGTVPHLIATVSDGTTTFASDGIAIRAGIAPTFGLKGRYTFAIPDARQAGLPRGDGWALFVGDAAGHLRFAGKFADGSPFSGDGAMQADGTVPIYILRKDAPVETLAGLLRFSDADGTNLTGDFTWTRFAGADGFAVTSPIAGGRFVPPAVGKPVFVFQKPGAKLARAKLVADVRGFPKRMTFKVKGGDITALPPNANGFFLNFSRKSGKVTGSFQHATLGRCKVSGVLVQPMNAVRGNFTGGGESGSFLLAPR